jgi:hypothetical protein
MPNLAVARKGPLPFGDHINIEIHQWVRELMSATEGQVGKIHISKAVCQTKLAANA